MYKCYNGNQGGNEIDVPNKCFFAVIFHESVRYTAFVNRTWRRYAASEWSRFVLQDLQKTNLNGLAIDSLEENNITQGRQMQGGALFPPHALHFSPLATLLGSIVCLNESRLAFVRLREGIPALFPHTLYLTHFANSFLELFHSAKRKLSMTGRILRTKRIDTNLGL